MGNYLRLIDGEILLEPPLEPNRDDEADMKTPGDLTLFAAEVEAEVELMRQSKEGSAE